MRVLWCVFVYCFLDLGICGCGGKDTEVIVSGKAPEGVSKMCLIQHSGMSRAVAEATVDSAGMYQLVYDAERPEVFVLADIKYKMNVSLYLVPGARMQVDFHNGKAEYSGDEKDHNQFLEALKVCQQELMKQHPGNLQIPAIEKEAIVKKANGALAFIDKAELKDVIFTGTLKATILRDKYSSLINYPDMYKMIFGVEVPVDRCYYDFVQEIDLSSPYWMNVGGVYGLLQDMFRVMETYGYLNVDTEDYFVKRGERIGNDRLREEYFLYALELEFYGFNQHFNELVAGIEKQITTKEGVERLMKLKSKYQAELAKNEVFLAGKPAFNFVGTDVMGKQHSLDEFRGKVVVVDVWNSGCKPCIAEIPFMKSLEKDFEGQDVVFVSYSLDTDVDIWKNFMANKNMSGNQWVDTLGFKSDFVRAFALTGIPRFMVFGRKGEIVDVFAPRPSDPRLALLLKRELK